MLHGKCHCGKVQFEIPDQALNGTICHCNDCRKQSGAPMLAWAMISKDAISIQGEPSIYKSSDSGQRSFCGTCGTGLFFTNEPLERMDMMQVRIAVLDNPDAIVPKMQVQTAERVGWMVFAHELPAFERFPG